MISKDNQWVLNEMDGEEVLSINYEGCVLIKGNQVIMNGTVIDILNTNKKIKAICHEAFINEFGC